jgi:uncharacterized coiled-coil DUF342 family protein
MEGPPEPHRKRQELRATRNELHGKRRKLHKQLSEVCEDIHGTGCSYLDGPP